MCVYVFFPLAAYAPAHARNARVPCARVRADRDGCPKIVNLGAAKTDLFYERKVGVCVCVPVRVCACARVCVCMCVCVDRRAYILVCIVSACMSFREYV